ncbi:hypothetical protein [Lacticaseibacillus suihuaensis]
MVALTQEAALAIVKSLGVTPVGNYLWGRRTGSSASRVVFDITSNPALYADLFERPVLLVFTAEKLWVYPLSGRHEGRPEALATADISDFRVSNTLTEKRLDMRVAGKCRHFRFPADRRGGMAYNGENLAYLTAIDWYGLVGK